MILRFCFFLIFILSVCQVGLAQIKTPDIKLLQNTARYTGSQEEFIKFMAKNLRYPASEYSSKKVGTVVGVLQIAKDGKIVAVGTINKAQPEFKAEFERVAHLTKGKWEPTNDTATHFYAIVPVQFKVVGSGYTLNSDMKPAFFQETIVITASGVARGKIEEAERLGAALYQRTEDELVAQVNAHAEKEDYEGAIKVLEELVNLQPLHTTYYTPLVKLSERTGRAEDAAYYTEVVKLLSK